MDIRIFGSVGMLPATNRAIKAFEQHSEELLNPEITRVPQVLDLVREDLVADGWACSSGPRSQGGCVLYETGKRRVLADAWHESGVALWIERGRAWTNNEFLVHAVDACLAAQISEVMIAVPILYQGAQTFARVEDALEEFWDSNRFVFTYRTLVLLGI